MPPILSVTGDWKGHQIHFRPDRLIVSIKPGHPVASILQSIASLIQVTFQQSAPPQYVFTPGRSWTVFKFSAPMNASAVLDLAIQIAHDVRIRYAEPAAVGEGHLKPSDTDYAKQWWPGKIGMEGAWDLTRGDNSVLLAVLDSGISISSTTPDHPDLTGSRYVAMHDYVDDDEVPRDEHYDGHGTHIAGIAAACSNNDKGVAGVNWKCPVYIARVLDGCNHFGSDDLYNAVDDLIDYATGKYDRVVVNISMGTKDATVFEHLREMCQKAEVALAGKMLLVVAAGPVDTSKVDIDYPAALAADFRCVMAVSATDCNDKVCELSRDNYDKITIFAPGNDIYSTTPTYDRRCTDSYGIVHSNAYRDYCSLNGTSMAAGVVSGVASLVWTLDPSYTAGDLRDVLKATAEVIQYQRRVGSSWVTTDHIRVSAWNALQVSIPAIELEDTHVIFSDVEPGEPVEHALIFNIGGACDLTFKVVTASLTGLPSTLSVAPLSGKYTPDMAGQFKLIAVKYEPLVAGDISYTEFQVECVEAAITWNVLVTATASTPDPANTDVVIVADHSGSMAEPSGIESFARMGVLAEASSIVVETLRVGDSAGVVAFSTAADSIVAMTEIVSGDPLSAERTLIKSKLAALVPDGTTSIGGGVELAASMLFDDVRPQQGMIVLTDGRENTAPFIADIMGALKVPVYAIGMGTAEALQPATLEILTAATGGYLLLTDTLDDTARFRVAKYALQMLEGIVGGTVVLDPATVLRPREEVSIPFTMCSDDASCEVLLLTPWPDLVRMIVRAPNGASVPENGRGLSRISGTRLVAHRFSLPLDGAHSGEWNVLLSVDEHAEAVLRERSAAAGYRSPSAPCSVLVATRSRLRMRCRAIAPSHRPGSTIRLRAELTRRGQGYDQRVQVVAAVRKGDREISRVPLALTRHGVFEGTFVASHEGVYECVVSAHGTIRENEHFRREQTVTAHIWAHDAVTLDHDRARAREAEPPS